MTIDKARKRAVRSRMTKTGERYAAARRHVTDAATRGEEPLPPRVADPGMTEEAIQKGTGRGWDAWFRDLDAWGATTRNHTAIARHLTATYPIGGWWAQAVTVGYERARGLRAVHETSRGFEVSVSKTLAQSPEAIWPWLADPGRRDRWVGTGLLQPAAEREPRWARFRTLDDDSTVRLTLDPKGTDRSVLTVTHTRLTGASDVAARRAQWRERVTLLDDLVRASGGPR